MDYFFIYLRQKAKSLIAFALFFLLFLLSFFLYQLPLAAVLYPAALCFLLGLVLFFFDFRHHLARRRLLLSLLDKTESLPDSLPAPEKEGEAETQALVRRLTAEKAARESELECRYEESIEYFSLWAHQIKTPIASMRLSLQNEDTPLSQRLLSELFRIEQYADMVLTYLRLDSDSTDYLLKEYALDPLVRQALRRFAPEFVARRLTLHYTPFSASALTDEKWLSFVIEQLLSNALKYTKEGGITIVWEEPFLVIRDTGIGIAPEDLPRVFEKGYTGCNGRQNKRASGIGLYLCRRILKNLGHDLTLTSLPGKGTAARIDFSRKETRIE